MRSGTNIMWKSCEIIACGLLAVVTYRLFSLQAAGDMTQSDLPQHLSIIESYIRGTYYIPHPAFHISVYYLAQLLGISIAGAAPIIMTLSIVATLPVVTRALSLFGRETEPRWSDLAAAISLLFVVAIYVPFFNANIYLGQYSPNIWHSQTMLMLRPAALVAFICYVRVLLTDKSFSLPVAVTGSFFLLASTAIKPSFVITFIPAQVLFHLLFHARDKQRWFRAALWDAPSIALLAYQFVQTYLYVGTDSYFHDTIIFTFFGFLKLYTPNLFISALLVLAFPLSVLLTDRQRCVRNPYLLMSWLVTGVAYLQAAFLAEEQKFEQGAFGFGYVNALFLLYIFSMHELLGRLRSEPGATQKPANLAPIALYMLHLASGIYYFGKLLNGGNFL